MSDEKWVTRDSGKRQDYPSGMRRDTQEDKIRFDLVPPPGVPYEDQMLTRWAELMTRGAVKYGDHNWTKAKSQEELDRFRGSAFRHFMQWYCGVEDGEDHAAAVFFNIQAAEFVKRRRSQPKLTEADEPNNVPPTLDGEPIGEDGLVDSERALPDPKVNAYQDNKGMLWFRASNPFAMEGESWALYDPFHREWGGVVPWEDLVSRRTLTPYEGSEPWA